MLLLAQMTDIFFQAAQIKLLNFGTDRVKKNSKLLKVIHILFIVSLLAQMTNIFFQEARIKL